MDEELKNLIRLGLIKKADQVERLADLEEQIANGPTPTLTGSDLHAAEHLNGLRSKIQKIWNPLEDTGDTRAKDEAASSRLDDHLLQYKVWFTQRSGQTWQLGKFQIESYIGAGGFGTVFRALDTSLGRRVAIKIPHARVLDSPSLRERFIREGAVAAQINHPNLLPVFESGEDNGLPYLAMAYCEGPTLFQWLQENPGPVEPRLAAQLVRAIALALGQAHSRGIVHRDVKPGNVLLMPCRLEDAPWAKEFPYLPCISDFGLAKIAEDTWSLSGSSVLIGTVGYMAWEQAAGKQDLIGPQSDVYALGVMLYELLTRRLPDRDWAIAILTEAAPRGPVPLRSLNPNVSKDLETVCLTCLETYPSRRYKNASEVAADLQNVLDNQPVAASRPNWKDFVARWFQLPSRRSDAGIYAIALNSVIILWVLMGFAQSPDYPELVSALPTAVVILLLTHVPMIVLGYLTLRGVDWAAWLGLALSLPLLGMVFVNFLGFGNLFEIFWKDKLVRTNMFFLLSLLFAIQTVAFAGASCAALHARAFR